MNKILILANSSSGLYNFRRDLIQKLIADSFSISACNPENDKSAELSEIGCKCINTEMDRRGINPIRDFKLLLRYKRIIKAEKPDLVITYTIKPNIYGGLVCRIKRVPYAANITGLGTAFENDGFLKKIVIVLYKAALKKAKVVFFENAENRKIFVDLGITKENRTKVLNGAGVNLDHFKYIDYPEQDYPFNFLFVGRIMKEKGVDELFFAMKRLVAEGNQVRLIVLGRYEEGYEIQVEQFQKDGWLEYCGYQPDVRPFIAKSHCFVLPSYHEGMANTNLECAASGRPLITSDIPGCKEAVIDGASGFLCEVKNADDLYEKMKQFIALSQEERVQMGLTGRKHMEDVFDKKKVVAETVSSLIQ